jgi:meso-butanediol dehydrogenase / (S,S)-butanediol dehydrogenase / diacetyl reductase
MGRFSGKAVVVTGGAHGIGRASALRFASEGARVAVVDLRGDLAEQVATECRTAGGEGRGYQADVSDPDQVAATVEQITSDLGGIDVVHLNAGRLSAGSVLEVSLAEWQRIFAVNVTGMFLVARAAIPVMRAGHGGAIVTTGSISGMFGEPALAAYTASKAAVVNLTRQMAIDFARDGIRVNCVCPGTFLSAMHAGLPAEAVDAIAAKHPLGLGTASDLVGAYSYLASDASRWTTGSAIVVDGGYAAP